ncbi:Tudor/PWWP/MBT superfamily protein [Zea mays]|nr:Tudor/PWWP/MBT superfamily protein [Zea mays]
MSPRSGTPVKLLGREDASVDWYNLEKSKRVKAFRCGEFDACIEKAEATQGTLVKKREKYARREDAILHALELERKQLASKYQTQGFRPGPPGNISACTKHHKDLGSTRYKSKKGKKRKDASVPPDVKKEVGQCFLPAGSKRNFSGSLTQGNLVSNHMGDFSPLGHSHGGATLENKESTVVKKNRSDGSDFEDSLVSKSDRRRPLSQVLQSSENLLPHLKQNDDFGALLIAESNNPSLAASWSRRNKYTYMASDSGETESHSDLPSIKMSSTRTDFENESYLQHPVYFSEEQTSDFIEKQITESSERECSESETEDDAELLQSSTVFGHYPLVWKSCPPKCRLFLCLVAHMRCWTADRLAKKGMDHPTRCLLCDQEAESLDHLVVSCVFTRDFWFHLLRPFGLESLAPQP